MPARTATQAALLPTNPDAVEVLAKFFRALGDPARLQLLEFLLHDEHTGTECVEYLGLAQSRVSTHLSCLADCGYVKVRREGRYTHYRVADPRVAQLGDARPRPRRRPPHRTERLPSRRRTRACGCLIRQPCGDVSACVNAGKADAIAVNQASRLSFGLRKAFGSIRPVGSGIVRRGIRRWCR